ncbi:MAG: hypothetical protein ACLPR9_20215 [Acidimicrobiales bacterium]
MTDNYVEDTTAMTTDPSDREHCVVCLCPERFAPPERPPLDLAALLPPPDTGLLDRLRADQDAAAAHLLDLLAAASAHCPTCGR